MSDGINFGPLTDAQKKRLDSHGNRIWTDMENRAMNLNLAHYDRVRSILSRRCGVPDCRFTVCGTKDNEGYALPNFSDVCDACYHMYYALKNPRLKNGNYFLELHNKWVRERDDPNKKDRLGL